MMAITRMNSARQMTASVTIAVSQPSCRMSLMGMVITESHPLLISE